MTTDQLKQLAETVKINERTLRNFKELNARTSAQNEKYQKILANWKAERRLS